MRGHCAASRCGPLPIGVILRLACLARTGLPSRPWRSIIRRQPVRQQIVGDPCDLVDIGGVVPPAVAHAEKDVHPRNRPGVDLARVGPDHAARGAVREALAETPDRGYKVAETCGRMVATGSL